MTGVSVIVPTFNRAGFLRETLSSILSQSVAAEEVIVIDDASTDETGAVAESFGSRIRYIRKTENRGKADSLNQALALVSRPLVWIVDDDDLVVPEALARLTALIEANPEAGFVYGRHIRFEDHPTRGRTLLDTGYWTECSPEDFLIATLEDFFVHQPGMLVRRSLYERAGPFDTSLIRSQDYEHLIRLARLATCASTQDVVFLQRQHPGPRGLARNQISASERDSSWMAFDQKIFTALHADMALGEYLPKDQAIKSDEDERQALIQRGVIFGRKKLWTLAIADFRAASHLGSAPVGQREIAILRRAFSSKYGCEELFHDPEILKTLRGIRQTGPHGREICRHLGRGLRWRVREALGRGRLMASGRLGVGALALEKFA